MRALPQTAQWHNVDLHLFKSEIIPLGQPAILKGVINDWPIVEAGKTSPEVFCQYLKRHALNKRVNLVRGQQKNNGRLFYNETLTGVNFKTYETSFNQGLDDILQQGNTGKLGPLYINSLPVKQHFAGLLNENQDEFFDAKAEPAIWIGNQTVVPTHYDQPDNIACCVSGKRRFTLFPPEQIANLYIGPIDQTPAGQATSLVDIANPDFQKYPKFKQALKHAQAAELEPGDALFIPSLWWHNVEALDNFNVLMTYFHDATPKHYGSPFECLLHGLMTFRNLPESKKHAWKAYFDHYVFSQDDDSNKHIPNDRLGVLGQQTPQVSNALKSIISHSLMK